MEYNKNEKKTGGPIRPSVGFGFPLRVIWIVQNTSCSSIDRRALSLMTFSPLLFEREKKIKWHFKKPRESACILVTISRVHDAHINKKIRSGAAIDSRNPISSILVGSNAEKGEKYPWRIRVCIVVNI
jgi:hypothetical protein